MALSRIQYDASGWQTLYEASSATGSVYVKMKYRNGMVTVTSNSSGGAMLNPNPALFGIVPEPFRPAIDISFAIGNRATNEPGGYGLIRSNGRIELANSLSENNRYWQFTVTYPAG